MDTSFHQRSIRRVNCNGKRHIHLQTPPYGIQLHILTLKMLRKVLKKTHNNLNEIHLNNTIFLKSMTQL